MGEYYEDITGSDHPGWAGGEFPYGEGWTEAKRERVREIYCRKCQGCGLGEAEYQRETGNKLSVHHIIPARRFDDPEKRNAERNLIPLCQSCHISKWEGIPLRPQLAD
jgi:5-methylcytosine-specific restriction endonuclease McrA